MPRPALEARWEDAHTVASGIRVPRAVSDSALLDCVKRVTLEDGVLLCPEGGATLAAYEAALAQGRVNKEESVLLFNCASGLKYPLEDLSTRLDRHLEIDFRSP